MERETFETLFNRLKVILKERGDNLNKELLDLEREFIFYERCKDYKQFKANKGDFITLHLKSGGKSIYLLSRDFDTLKNPQVSFYLSTGTDSDGKDQILLGPDHMTTMGTIGQKHYYDYSTPEEIEYLMTRLIKLYRKG